MDEQRGTSKQIAKRYEDKVDYRNTRTPYRRARNWLSVCLILAAIVAIYLGSAKTPSEFFNTGPLSSHHSRLPSDCAACHQPQPRNPGWFVQVVNDRFHNGAPSFERLDHACESCHQQHAFHEPNVVDNRSCSACHQEHQGPGPMKAVVSLDCASCHNNASVMQASAQFGHQLPPTQFHLNPKVANPAGARLNVLQLPRPPNGYTTTFTSFSDGHPPFGVQQQNVRESDALRFNHQLHLTGRGIPPTPSGSKLDCNYCHKPEPNGRYMERVNFEAHCQACHSLQFDVKNPDFQLPHGDAQLVRTFLRTLPAQYAELARRKRGLTNETRIGEFTGQQIRQLLTQFASGEELERTVFFTKDPYRAAQQSQSATRAKYTGCAYCHEVRQAGGAAYPLPEVTAPVFVDRWMPHARFNHAKHQSVSCEECHSNTRASHLTSDVLMPTKESCVRCHSPGGVAMNASECMTCHAYHAPDERHAAPAPATTAAVGGSFKHMLLGAAR